MPVAALYIDPRGPYPKLLGADRCWDETRDARTYAGPWPVVAHPPCGPWGRMSQFCKQDASSGLHALDVVRRFGGVVEQPAHSRLFDGLAVVVCNQLAWGHACSKPTWLYVVGCTVSGIPHGRNSHAQDQEQDCGRPVAGEPRDTPPHTRRLRRVAHHHRFSSLDTSERVS